MSHPKKLEIFRAWAKAMELGATVDKPSYGKTQHGSRLLQQPPARKRKRRGTSRRRRRLKKKRMD